MTFFNLILNFIAMDVQHNIEKYVFAFCLVHPLNFIVVITFCK